ncbi:hypothetical protein [Ureibacillus terrenus]|nr:hypothetical protein [Ureibacillus terrenus]
MLEYTKTIFEAVLMTQNDELLIPPSKYWTSEFLAWDKEDIRPRQLIKNDGPLIIKEGRARGKILAGNMGTMLLLAGTEFLPSFDNKVLFLEEDEQENPGTIDRYLTQLRHMGVFEKINGIVVGRFHPKVEFSQDYTFVDIICQATKGYDFPIVYNVDFGHTDPMMTIPNGIDVKVEASNNNVTILFRENPVQAS